MTHRIVMAWLWFFRVTKLNLVLQGCIEAHLDKRFPAQALESEASQVPQPTPKDSVQPAMTRVEWDFVTGADGFRCHDGKCISVSHGRYVREQ